MSDKQPLTPDSGYIVLRSEDVQALAEECRRIADGDDCDLQPAPLPPVDRIADAIRAAAVEVPECVPNLKCGLAALSYEAPPEQPTEPWEDAVMRSQADRALAALCVASDQLLNALDAAGVPSYFAASEREALRSLLHDTPSQQPTEPAGVEYRAVQSVGGVWFLWRGIPAPDDGDNGGMFCWKTIGPLDMIPAKRGSLHHEETCQRCGGPTAWLTEEERNGLSDVAREWSYGFLVKRLIAQVERMEGAGHGALKPEPEVLGEWRRDLRLRRGCDSGDDGCMLRDEHIILQYVDYLRDRAVALSEEMGQHECDSIHKRKIAELTAKVEALEADIMTAREPLMRAARYNHWPSIPMPVALLAREAEQFVKSLHDGLHEAADKVRALTERAEQAERESASWRRAAERLEEEKDRAEQAATHLQWGKEAAERERDEAEQKWAAADAYTRELDATYKERIGELERENERLRRGAQSAEGEREKGR